MQLYNIKHPEETVSFSQAVLQGLGKDQGLFFPSTIPTFSAAELSELLLLEDFHERAYRVLSKFIGDEFTEQQLRSFIKNAFNFPCPVAPIDKNVSCLELFHGPTLAFKDFGARFMAQILNQLGQDRKITIVTATSGDTGAAVAHAFYKLDKVNVCILYPKGKISELQEKLFCCLGENIKTIAVNGVFDDCQAMVKQTFDDTEVKQAIGLNSANSINICRLLAQVTYYFEAFAQSVKRLAANANLEIKDLLAPEQVMTFEEKLGKAIVFSVPSGNFGDLTAGLIAKAMGLPVKRFFAACNANDTIPRYLATGDFRPHPTQATLSNAMDVSKPNNWPRIEELVKVQGWDLLSVIHSASVTDEVTAETIQELDKMGYVSEPHGAVGYRVMRDQLEEDEHGIFLGTAHPAKFKADVERILGREIDLPPELGKYLDSELLSLNFEAYYPQLRDYLLANFGDKN